MVLVMDASVLGTALIILGFGVDGSNAPVCDFEISFRI